MTHNNQFQNENLAVTMTRKPGSKVFLDVKVSPAGTDAAFHKAVKNINKQVSLPGFRKGKAPEATIVKKFGQYIEREWHDILIRTTFTEALELTKIYPYNENVVAKPVLKSVSKENGSEVTFEYETAPEVPVIDPTSLILNPVEKKEVSEEKMKQALEDIRFQHAVWLDITDRPVELGDYIEIDIENIEGEAPIPLFQHTRFKVDAEYMGNWMQKLVIGRNIGDSVEGVSEYEKKDDISESEFRPTHLRVTIHKVQTATLPEINEEFAKKLGLENVDSIHAKVQKELDGFAVEDQQAEIRDQLANLLIQNYHVDLPASMVEPDMKRSSEAAIREVKTHAKKGEDISAKTQQAAAQAAKQIENNYKVYFLLKKVADDNKITVDSREIMHELMRQMFAVHPSERIINPQGDPKESRSRIFAFLLQQKAKDWLIEQAMSKQEKA